MALSYNWKIKSMKVVDSDDLANIVIGIQWDLTGTDASGVSGTFSGATPFTLPQVDPDEFIDFDELTEEVVVGWLEDVVVGGYKEHVDSQIQKQIDAKKNPIREVSQLPWEPVPPTPPTP